MAIRWRSLLQMRWIERMDGVLRYRAGGLLVVGDCTTGAIEALWPINYSARSMHRWPSPPGHIAAGGFSFLVVHRRICGNESLLARTCCPKIATFYMNVSEPVSRCCSAVLAWLIDLAVSSCFSTNRLVLFPAAHDFKWCF